jgi:hypothetical protein
MAWRSEAREEFEVKDARSAPPPAAARRAVLEFEFLSRKIAAKQSTDEFSARQRRKGSIGRIAALQGPPAKMALSPEADIVVIFWCALPPQASLRRRLCDRHVLSVGPP